MVLSPPKGEKGARKSVSGHRPNPIIAQKPYHPSAVLNHNFIGKTSDVGVKFQSD